LKFFLVAVSRFFKPICLLQLRILRSTVTTVSCQLQELGNRESKFGFQLLDFQKTDSNSGTETHRNLKAPSSRGLDRMLSPVHRVLVFFRACALCRCGSFPLPPQLTAPPTRTAAGATLSINSSVGQLLAGPVASVCVCVCVRVCA
jgi:hypothetical protein